MKIDIVIPIYNAFEVLKKCLSSLEKNQKQANRIILIDDASTDKNIKPFIKKLAIKNNWEVMFHQKNLGFVKTANEGLKLSRNNTILLNSDTIVSKNWLSAFKSIKVNDLGTATAWSNNAEICSFPEFLKNNNPPKNIDNLSEIIFRKYKPIYPNIPTAVGFCMLITKLAKEKVGYFDERHFGHGYGEENDYSLRVKKVGLKNILCDNAFVVHFGNESFSDFGLQPSEETMNRLLVKHPDYNQLIHDYISKDPLSTIRAKILLIIEKNDNKIYKDLVS